MTEIQEYECDCEKCVRMCEQYPCRPIPLEIRDMPTEVRARLMLQEDGDGLYGIPHLQAGAVGFDVGHAPNFRAYFGIVGSPHRCTFLTADERCELHGKCKPFEGRAALHGESSERYFAALQKAWDTDEGRQVIEEWKQEFMHDKEAKK